MPDIFDPNKFIDREFEMELFERMLRFESNARILAICDSSGMGKSLLLEMFRYRCRTVQRIPVSLIKLNELPDETPLALARAVTRDLRGFQVSFPTFEQYETARVGGDFAAIRVAFRLDRASFAGAEVRMAGVNIERAGPVTVTPSGALSPEQDAWARDVCLRAFLDDLRAASVERPVVVLLDAYEHCHQNVPALRDWLLETLLDKTCFDPAQRPARLLLVLAGRELPTFTSRWTPDECATVVESVAQLRKWERRHVAEWLHLYRPGCPDHWVETFYDAFQEGRSPKQAMEAIQIMLGDSR
jgi:hypothetical protein